MLRVYCSPNGYFPSQIVCAFHISTTHAIWSARLAVFHFKQTLGAKATSSLSTSHVQTHPDIDKTAYLEA